MSKGKNHKIDCKCIICLSDSKGEKNGYWKGDKVGYAGVHLWIRRRKIKPKVCEKCKKEKRLDLSNVSGKYKRDVNDYRYLCKSCHSKYDGYNLKGYKGKDYKESIGENNGRAKLKENQVIEIRKLLKNKKLTKTAIAKKFNVSIYPICAISKGKLWKHI